MKAELPALPCLHGLRVLVAERQPADRPILSDLLARAGARVACAASGRHALALLQGDAAFDVVLIDLRAPQLDGYAVARLIRAERRAMLPIVALTASTLPGEKMRCMQAGMNAVLPTPYYPAELYATLQRFARAPRGSLRSAEVALAA